MTAPITPDERAAMRERYTADLPSSWTAQGAWRRAILDRGQHAGADVPRLLDALDTAEADLDGFASAVSQWKRRALDAEAEIARLREEAAPVRPDRETIADVLMSDWHGEYTCECQTDRCPSLPCPTSTPSYVTAADAVLDLWPGESRATVQAEALRDAADWLADMDDGRDTGQHRAGRDIIARLRDRADRLDPKEADQ